MTVKEFIKGDMQSGDFTLEEIKLILRGIQKPKFESALNEQYYEYSQIDEIYQQILR